MVHQQTLIAIGCFVAGVSVGLAAEFGIRRTPRLASARGIAFPLAAGAGIYAAAGVFGNGRIAPATQRAFVAYLIVLATWLAARLAGMTVNRYGRRSAGSMVSVSVFVSVVEFAVFVVGALVVLDYLGISVAPILTAFGIGGLAVALALQNTLADFFAGVQIAASGQIHPGDYIKVVAGSAGTVVDINWRNTVIADRDRNHIVVPNQKLAAAVFTNYRLPLRVDVPLTLARSADVGRMTDLARDTAATLTPRLRPQDVEVNVAHATPDALDVVVRLPADDVTDGERVRSEFMRAFLERSG